MSDFGEHLLRAVKDINRVYALSHGLPDPYPESVKCQPCPSCGQMLEPKQACPVCKKPVE